MCLSRGNEHATVGVQKQMGILAYLELWAIIHALYLEALPAENERSLASIF
jgi:hypothetical protein